MNLPLERGQWRILTGAILAATAMGLTACGGGGGGGSSDDGDTGTTSETSYTASTVTATVDSDNAEEAAGSSVDAVSSGAGTSTLAESGTVATGVSGETALSLAAATLEAGRATRDLGSAGGRLAGATTSETVDCESGTVTYTFETGGNSSFDASGDYMEFDYNSCSLGATTYDGSLTFTWQGGDFSTDSFAIGIEYGNLVITESGTTLFGANGTMAMKAGSQAGNFPTGHTSAYTGGADFEINMGVSSTLDVVDNQNNQAFRYTDAKTFYSDGNGDGTLSTTSTWYMAMHGEGAGASSNTMELCTSDLNGCVNVDHGVTTAFTFTGGSAYPTSGVLQVNGQSGTYVKLDAGTGDPTTVALTFNDGSGETTTTENWSDISDRDFSSTLN